MIESLLEIWRSLTDPDRLILLLSEGFTGWLGYAVLAGIVFAESGLLAGLFLPGDSLLFTVGVVAGAGQLDIAQICALFFAASVAGDQTGYFLGHRTGPRIFSKPESLIFKKQYISDTQAFYEKHGGKTLIYAKFVPIVRAFAPYMAGVARMPYGRFLLFNIIGGLGWVLTCTLGGYYLGAIPLVRRHFEKVALLIVFVSVAPLIFQFAKQRLAARRASA